MRGKNNLVSSGGDQTSLGFCAGGRNELDFRDWTKTDVVFSVGDQNGPGFCEDGQNTLGFSLRPEMTWFQCGGRFHLALCDRHGFGVDGRI